jgi:hypothetical protein
MFTPCEFGIQSPADTYKIATTLQTSCLLLFYFNIPILGSKDIVFKKVLFPASSAPLPHLLVFFSKNQLKVKY